MIVLDTNVVSELMRPSPSALVVSWVGAQPTDDPFLTSITVTELIYGVARLPAGRRRADLAEHLARLLDEDFAGAILAFDSSAALEAGAILAADERHGRSLGQPDAYVAGLCRSADAGLATRNTKDFAGLGLDLFNPWDRPTSGTRRRQ